MSLDRALLIAFRWGIFLLACAFLYTRFAGPKGIAAILAWEAYAALPWFRWAMTLVCGLMLVNWWLESVKWRLLVKPLVRVSPTKAFMATIAGTSIGLVTINRTGDLLGRVLFLPPEHRVSGGFSTILGSIAQFVITLMAGGCSLIMLMRTEGAASGIEPWASSALVALTALTVFVTLLLYLHPTLLRQSILRIPILDRLERSSWVLEKYSRGQLVRVLLLSGSRYMVFTGQYVLLLMATGSGLSIMAALAGVAVVYLISTMVPTIMLTELGVRGSVAIAVLVPIGALDTAVLFSTTMVWMINVALPAMVGSVILLVARYGVSKNRP